MPFGPSTWSLARGPGTFRPPRTSPWQLGPLRQTEPRWRAPAGVRGPTSQHTLHPRAQRHEPTNPHAWRVDCGARLRPSLALHNPSATASTSPSSEPLPAPDRIRQREGEEDREGEKRAAAGDFHPCRRPDLGKWPSTCACVRGSRPWPRGGPYVPTTRGISHRSARGAPRRESSRTAAPASRFWVRISPLVSLWALRRVG
jgi:hypothetical protein